MIKEEICEMINNLPEFIKKVFSFRIINNCLVIRNDCGYSTIPFSQISHIDIDHMVTVWGKHGVTYCFPSTGNMSITFFDEE